MTAGRSKTPARVQVFYFEKPKLAPARTFEERPTDPGPAVASPASRPAPDDQDEPTVRTDALGPGSKRRAHATPLPRPCARARPQSSPSRPAPPADPRLPGERAQACCARPRRRLRPSPGTLTPLERLSNSAEALEFHRRKLQALAARSEQEAASFAERALFGHALFVRGRVREAQVVFEEIVAKEPTETLAYTLLGSIFLAQQDEARALALFEAALAIDPEDPAALVARAEIRLARGQPSFALGDLERAVAACQGNRDPFGERAGALLVLARTLARPSR